MSGKVYASDFLNQKKRKINFDRLVELMSKTKFYQFLREPTALERPAAERDMDSFHAARLFDLSEAWADPARREDAKLEKIEKVEDFAANLLLGDIRSGKLGLWALPQEEESTDEEIKTQLRKVAAEEQERIGRNYHSPTLVYWLSLHGFNDEILKKCFDETYNLIQEVAGDFTEIEREAEAEFHSAERASGSESSLRSGSRESDEDESESAVKSLSRFPLNTQITLFYKYLFSSFFLAFYEGNDAQLSIGEAEDIDKAMSPQAFRLLIKNMIAKTCAEISVLNSKIPSSPEPSRRPSLHVHRRRLSVAAQFSHSREEVTHSCPEIYQTNPLHFVLDYLDSQMNNYDIRSKDSDIISRKRDLVTQACLQVDAREITLLKAVDTLLLEDDLHQRRNVWDCLHKTPRTVRLIKACLLGVSEVEKLLPKSALGRARHSKVKQVMGQIVVV